MTFDSGNSTYCTGEAARTHMISSDGWTITDGGKACPVYTITASAGTGGSIDPSGAVSVDFGADQNFTIAPDTGYHVADVFVDGVSESEGVITSYTFENVDSNHTITASFAVDTFTLTYTAGSGGSLIGDTSQIVNYGANGIAITAIPDLGYHFVNWSDGSTANPRTDINVTGNVTVTASFTANTYTLEVTVVGNGAVTKEPDKTSYLDGEEVTLTATPEEGWSFGSWSENVFDGKVTIHGNTTVTASFTQNEYTLTINSNHGTVVKSPDQDTYHEDDVVLLTATANLGWAFENWTGDLVSSNNPDSVTIHGNTTVTANYTAVSVAPTFTSEAVTSVNEDALYTYNITATDPNVGDTLTITAPTKPAWLTFTDNGSGSATLTGTPTNAEVGSHDVVLTVSDGALTDEQTFSIAVANTNDAPTFTSSPDHQCG